MTLAKDLTLICLLIWFHEPATR